MLDIISKFLAVQIAEILHEKEKINILEYGLQIILNTTISFASVIMLGLLMNKALPTFLYLFSYCIIRLWAGGFHASTNEKCILIFICLYLSSSVFVKYVDLNKIMILLLLFIQLILLSLLAPVGANNNPIPQYLKCRMKGRAIISCIIVGIIILIQNDMTMSMYGVCGMLWSGILLLVGKFYEKE